MFLAGLQNKFADLQNLFAGLQNFLADRLLGVKRQNQAGSARGGTVAEASTGLARDAAGSFRQIG